MSTTQTKATEHTYKIEVLKVSDLQVDPRVQRDGLRVRKVQEIDKKFNPGALGVLVVSRRRDRGVYIIDGWHRHEVLRRKGIEEVTCHVFEGLTVPEEALMFLDLNYADQPTLLEKYKARITAEDEAAVRIDQIVSSRGWKVSPVPTNGNINAVGTLLRLDELSTKVEADPHLIDVTLLVITRAWGIDRHGSQSVILEGIGRVLAEYGDKVNINVLIEKLRDRPGGPATLHAEAAQLASVRKGRVSMAVAELVVEAYNKSRRGGALPNWRKRS